MRWSRSHPRSVCVVCQTRSERVTVNRFAVLRLGDYQTPEGKKRFNVVAYFSRGKELPLPEAGGQLGQVPRVEIYDAPKGLDYTLEVRLPDQLLTTGYDPQANQPVVILADGKLRYRRLSPGAWHALLELLGSLEEVAVPTPMPDMPKAIEEGLRNIT